jgi:oligopeptide/dipeptide ABC transporter ATP-binding protein
MSALLRVRDLRTSFRDRHGLVRAVDGVNFDLEDGEVLGVVGESGAGKSVMAHSLLRLIEEPGRIEPGSVVEYRGTNILELSPTELRRVRGAEIAMVFQDPGASLNPVLRVGTQITETLRAHRTISRRDAKARAVELLGMVGVPEPALRIDAYPHELSGGLQQRVMLAIALSCEPKILIADEPTTALDVTVQAQILDLLAEITRRLHTALILISHDLGVVARLADRIGVMYGGQIVEQASTRDIFDRPSHPYTQALLAAAPQLEGTADRLMAIPGTIPSAARWPQGCRFHPRCPVAWDRCRAEWPPLLEAAPEHDARCWLIEEPERRFS